MLRGGGAGADADGVLRAEPRGIDFVGRVDQEGRAADGLGDFAEAVGVGGVARADDEEDLVLYDLFA